MGKKLHVLLIEDSELDAYLIVKILQQNGFNLHWRRVETAPDMQSALEEETWDIILSDYNMPQFTGMEALELYLSFGYDIPFILVSGAIGEETSVKVMKAGAHDYIMKDKLTRLVPAIKRELKEAETRKQYREAQQALEENEQKFRLFFENEPEYCYIVGPDGIIQDVNRAALRVLGYSKKGLIGSPIQKIYAPEALSRVEQCFQHWTQTGSLKNEELEILTKGGERRTVLLSASAVTDTEGRIVHSVSVQRDVTERIKAEKEREHLIQELKDALQKVKMLSGLLPICASCKKIRDDRGYWMQVESYISEHSDARFSHGFCPDCADKYLNDDLYAGLKPKKKRERRRNG
jgi:PAS domain S-box-containing protein